MSREEISDFIIDYDPQTLARRPVQKQQIRRHFLSINDLEAVQIIERLPERDGHLDNDKIDALFIRVHCELQRLWEEFEQGERLRNLLRPLISALREAGHQGAIRVVDIGCGLGFGVRWLAAKGDLGEDVELIGADYNAALINEANALSARENLRCRFVVANAFRLQDPATIFMSTGVIHHFRDQGLTTFFQEQSKGKPAAFFHFDLEPTYLTMIGAWIFHKARMREPLSFHDGLSSAARAHSAKALLQAAKDGAPEYDHWLLDAEHGWFPILDIFHAVLCVRPNIKDAFLRVMGEDKKRLSQTPPRGAR